MTDARSWGLLTDDVSMNSDVRLHAVHDALQIDCAEWSFCLL